MKTKLQVYIITFVQFFLFTCDKHPHSNSIKFDSNPMDKLLNEHVENGDYPFLYARIENVEGKILYEHSVINKDLLPGLNVDENSWIRIWSMSKIVTISILMDLVEDNLVSLDEPVSKYIPEFENLKVAVSSDGKSLSVFTQPDTYSNAEVNKMTAACPMTLVEPDSIMQIRHLINHRAGFYYANTKIPCLDSISIEEDITTVPNSDSLIAVLARMPLIHHPGERYHYGLNTTVLGLVAERVANRSLEEIVKERITIPCKINQFQYKVSNEVKLIPPVTGRDGYLRRANKGELDIMGKNVPQYNLQQKLYLGGEGMISSADGYADFLRLWLKGGILNGHRFLNESTIEKMITSVDKKDGYGTSTKYNLYITGDSTLTQGKGDRGLWQGGGYEGTSFWMDPKRDFVGLLFTQVNQSPDHAGLGSGLYDKFRGMIYEQIFSQEKNTN